MNRNATHLPERPQETPVRQPSFCSPRNPRPRSIRDLVPSSSDKRRYQTKDGSPATNGAMSLVASSTPPGVEQLPQA